MAISLIGVAIPSGYLTCTYGLQIAFGGVAHGVLAVGSHGEFWKGAVDAVESEGLDGSYDALNDASIERDVIGVAPHEADGAAVGNYLDGVASE